MIKNYLLLAIKHLKKQKVFSVINILGLTVGITCCLMIFLFIMNELSYDNFHKNGKNIYRVVRLEIIMVKDVRYLICLLRMDRL
jgi:putative ABC transport system permease protein